MMVSCSPASLEQSLRMRRAQLLRFEFGKFITFIDTENRCTNCIQRNLLVHLQ